MDLLCINSHYFFTGVWFLQFTFQDTKTKSSVVLLRCRLKAFFHLKGNNRVASTCLMHGPPFSFPLFCVNLFVCIHLYCLNLFSITQCALILFYTIVQYTYFISAASRSSTGFRPISNMYTIHNCFCYIVSIKARTRWLKWK